MTDRRRTMGSEAEDLAARRLAVAGWEIVVRNVRTRYGELDIVAREGTSLVFVEVKAGRLGAAYGPERPVLAIGPRKQRQVRRLATAWMAENRDLPLYSRIRFDAIGVTYDHAGRVVAFEHIRAAF